MAMRAHRLAPDAVLVHVAHELQRVALGRHEDAVRVDQRVVAGDGAAAGGTAEALELALRQRAIHHHDVGLAGDDRRRRIAHRGRTAAAAAAPLHVGQPQLLGAERGGEPRRVVAIVAVGGEAVDVARIDPGILGRRQDRHQRQLELGFRRLPVLVVGGLADPDDGHLAAQAALDHRLRPSLLRGDQPVDRHAFADADALLVRRGVESPRARSRGSAPSASRPDAPAPWRGTPASPPWRTARGFRRYARAGSRPA